MTIGTSSEPVKCVADPGDVQCDSTAKELGRTGKWPDTFHIYHHGHEMLGPCERGRLFIKF